MQNHFELFHLPQRFALDMAALDAAYHEVQNQVHPDRFAHASDAEKRVAMQWATRANEAYQTLKNPLKRAHVSVRTERRRPADRIEYRDAGRVPDAADGVARSAGRCEGEPATAPRWNSWSAKSAPDTATKPLAQIGALARRRRFPRRRARRCAQLMFLEKFGGRSRRRLRPLQRRTLRKIPAACRLDRRSRASTPPAGTICFYR